MLPYQILASTIYGKVLASYTKTINSKYQLLHEMINLNYLMDHIMYQIFKMIYYFEYIMRKDEAVTSNLPVSIYVNSLKN